MRKVVGHVCQQLSVSVRPVAVWNGNTIRSRSASMVIHLKTNRFNCQNALLRCVDINNMKSKQCVRWIDGLTACVIHDDDDWWRNREFSCCHQRISAPLDQFSTHCVSRITLHKGPNWREKVQWIKNVRDENVHWATAWYPNILVNSFVVTFKLVHQRRVRWPVRSWCTKMEICLYNVCRYPLSTTAMHLSTVTSRLTIFSFSFFVLGFLCHRLHLWAHDSLVLFYLKGDPLVSETPENCYVSFFKCENGQSWRWAANRTYISPRRHWPKTISMANEQEKKTNLAYGRCWRRRRCSFSFRPIFSFCSFSFNSNRENYSLIFFFVLVFFICFLYFVFFCYLRAKLTPHI